MKRILIVLGLACLVSFSFVNKVQAQMVAIPGWYYTGVGTMTFWNGVYYGYIYCGIAQGEGYYYFYDGSVFHGNFNAGLAHGRGEMICYQGYVAGVWEQGRFVQQLNVDQRQIQNTYNVAQNNYNNSVQNSYQQQQNNDMAISNYRIEEIDSDTQLGRQLLGKISK